MTKVSKTLTLNPAGGCSAAFAFVYEEERAPQPVAKGPLAWLMGGGRKHN